MKKSKQIRLSDTAIRELTQLKEQLTQQGIRCVTLGEVVCHLLTSLQNDDTLQKLRVIYRKPIVKEILKGHNIDLDTFDWKNYKPSVEVKP